MNEYQAQESFSISDIEGIFEGSNTRLSKLKLLFTGQMPEKEKQRKKERKKKKNTDGFKETYMNKHNYTVNIHEFNKPRPMY